MINISDFKQLGIILPNTNKALSKVLTEATHKELESITQGKDLKTVMSNLLKHSGKTPDTNKELLQLVKNNPTLKSLGDVTTTLKDLLNSIKSDKNPLPLEKVLQSFLNDIKDLKGSELKQKLENSGVFLESRLKNVKNPQQELKNTLTTLVKNLQESNAPISRVIANEVKVILNTEVLKAIKAPISTIQAGQNLQTKANNLESILTTKENPKALQQLSSSLETLVTKLKTTIAKADAIHHPTLSKALEHLEQKLEPKLLNTENFKLAPIKESLEQVSSIMSKSFTVESKGILDSLSKIFLSLKSVDQATTTSKAPLESFLDKKVPQQISQLTENIKSVIQKLGADHNPILSKALEQLEQKLEPRLLNAENFKLAPIKESLEQVSTIISKSFTVESKGILDSLNKIFQALKSVDQATTTSKATLESFLDKKVPQQISRLSEDIKSVIQKAEPVFHKETQTILNKLETLNTPQKLHPQNNVKEIINSDLRAVLLKTTEDIIKTNHPNQAEISKNIDKLSLQIDNYQLLSHLSNGTSLYLPYSWDMMEDGKIEMKKSDDDKFYCDIYLKLKEYGEVNLKLTLYDKNQLNLHIYSSNEQFKSIIQENIPMLRSALIYTQITPREIRIHEVKTSQASTSPYKQESTNGYSEEIHMGFEVKG